VLEITPASVTGMIKRLAASHPPLVEYQKHRGVVLTDEGEEIALEIIRHHRLIELFLYETLGYSWDEVDAEADKLEHVISEEFEEK
ncbi:MAG: metal-dependent transcriptional regulator, partial [candidate division Zixibacteria bacterium]|nr:metal-dependent transcriptional regulator [candidate division Zixibacteria bacterium]